METNPIPKVIPQVKWFDYAMAWIQFAGAWLTKAGNLGTIIRDSFADIHPPKKDDFIKK